MATLLDRWAKKRHLKSKVEVTQKKIWDFEFYRRQLENEKEGIRLEYDRIKEALDAATLRLKIENEKPADQQDKQVIANLENLVKKYTPDMEQMKGQMSAIDFQIDGYEMDDPENPGQKVRKQGVKEMIEQHRSLMGLLNEYRDSV